MKRRRASPKSPERSGRMPPGEDVYERLRDWILNGRIAPGTRLVETEFARRLEVSRTPVREAMRRLAYEGLANIVGAGAKTQIAVAPVTRGDLVDLFAIIGALEGVAGRGVETLTLAERRSLAQTLSERNAVFATQSRRRSPDFARLFAAHDAFHSAFVERCASVRLKQLIDAVRVQVKRYELIYANAIGHDFANSVREHRAIIAAFRAGNAERVEQAIRRNWTNSAARLLSRVNATAVTDIGDYRSTPEKSTL